MSEKKIIKVAFPHMGNVYIAWAAALKKLGIEPLIPPMSAKKTLELGTKYSPDSICLPYKLILGNFLQAIEKTCPRCTRLNLRIKQAFQASGRYGINARAEDDCLAFLDR